MLPTDGRYSGARMWSTMKVLGGKAQKVRTQGTVSHPHYIVAPLALYLLPIGLPLAQETHIAHGHGSRQNEQQCAVYTTAQKQ